MGLFDFLKKKKTAPPIGEDVESPPGSIGAVEMVNGISISHTVEEALSYGDKERIMVERMTAQDMLQFTDMPYNLNCGLQKVNDPKSHAYAYMELNGSNIDIAKLELQKLNIVIDYAKKIIPAIPKWARIDTDKIAFYNYSSSYGYSKLICTPYTFTGKISKFPLSLLFISFQPKDSLGYSVNGEIKYFADGKIASATVNCWHRKSWEQAGDGWQYFFYDNDGNLTMREILSTVKPDKYGMPGPIYKCPALLQEEKEREKKQKEYDWLQKNLPDLCPKSLSGYTRMKNANSKNYQKIVEAARQLGKEL